MLPMTFEQRRVLGVLIEKSLTTPDSYPMTLSALTAACNQKTNRDPITDFSEGDVGRVIHELSLRQLVRLAPTDRGARSNRFQHEVEDKLGWARSYQALLCELLLRGPQTPGELRTRGSRMVSLPSLETVQRLLDELAGKTPPVVRALPREPGRSAVRYMHLLYPEGEAPAAPAPVGAASPPATATREEPGLGERVAALEAEVAALRAAVDDLHQDRRA